MLFTMICTCPFLQESGEFSLSSLHPPIRQRTASCTYGFGGVQGGKGQQGGASRRCRRERGSRQEKREGIEMVREEKEMMQREEVSAGTLICLLKDGTQGSCCEDICPMTF